MELGPAIAGPCVLSCSGNDQQPNRVVGGDRRDCAILQHANESPASLPSQREKKEKTSFFFSIVYIYIYIYTLFQQCLLHPELRYSLHFSFHPPRSPLLTRESF